MTRNAGCPNCYENSRIADEEKEARGRDRFAQGGDSKLELTPLRALGSLQSHIIV